MRTASMTNQSDLPPAVRAIIALGGPTDTAKALGKPVTRGMVESWMRAYSIPLGYLRHVARLAHIPLEEFYEFEEAKVKRD
jgi:hypothetical protein